MAKTGFTTSDTQVKKAWEEKTFRETEKMSYFSKFMSSSVDSPVQVKTNLSKDKGDTITFTYVQRLSGSGVTSGQTLEGNEEKLTTYTGTVALEQYRHAIRDDGALSRQRAAFSIEDEHKQMLQIWGREKIDSLCFTALQNAPTKCFYFAPTTGALTANTLTNCKAGINTEAPCKITLSGISALKTWAQTGGGRVYPPLRPFRVEGQDHYVLLVNPDVAYDLKSLSTYQSAAQYAMERGKTNPLFTGATLVWDNVIIHTHENMINYTGIGTGSNDAGSLGVLMGAQALVWAWGKREEWVQKNFDYENEKGYAWGIIAGVTKPVFNSKDYGSVGVVFNRSTISDL